MNRKRNLLFSALVVAATSTFVGCKEEPRPEAKPEPPAAVTSNLNPKIRPNMRNPMAQANIDPQTTKEYRVDSCYFGTLSLRQAKEAYFASLGKDEPSEKKIPNFGTPPVPAGADAGAAKNAAPGMPGHDGGAVMPPRPDGGLRAPHERNARACPIAAGLAAPPMPDIDKVLADFSPVALELAKTIGAASTYYQREEFKTDAFAKGKEFHKTLVADFAKLDDMHAKLGDAVAAWHKDHLADPTKLEGGQKPATVAIEAARVALLAALPKKIDVAAFKASLDKLDSAIADLKTFGDQNPADPYARVLGSTLAAFDAAAKDAVGKAIEKGIDSEDFIKMVTTFTTTLDANQRALSRALIAKGQTTAVSSGSPTPPPPPPAPAPAGSAP